MSKCVLYRMLLEPEAFSHFHFHNFSRGPRHPSGEQKRSVLFSPVTVPPVLKLFAIPPRDADLWWALVFYVFRGDFQRACYSRDRDSLKEFFSSSSSLLKKKVAAIDKKLQISVITFP